MAAKHNTLFQVTLRATINPITAGIQSRHAEIVVADISVHNGYNYELASSVLEELSLALDDPKLRADRIDAIIAGIINLYYGNESIRFHAVMVCPAV